MRSGVRRHPARAGMVVIGASVLSGVGCVDDFLSPEPASDPVALFDLVWTEFDRHYAFFLEKGIDWNALRDRYRPELSPLSTPSDLLDVLGSMLDHLQDGHVNIFTPIGGYTWDGWQAGRPENFDRALALNHVRGGATWTAGRTIAWGRVTDDVGYVHIPDFGGQGWGGGIDEALDGMHGIRALIVDIRSNGGGSDRITDEILGRFHDRERVYRHYRYRNGPGHGDFTDLKADRIVPDGRGFTGPVALLTNRRNFSTAEDFVLGMRLSERVVTVGDSTGGGTGNPISRELPNGWTFRLSRWQVFDADRRPLPEGVGFAPDVFVALTAEDVAAGRDTILLRALAILEVRLAESG